jgi:aminoglycoside phosphotransferase (APT) family kinase protein
MSQGGAVVPGGAVDIAPYRAAIVDHDPALAGAPIVAHTGGWHSVALEVDRRLIFKFPRHDFARTALRREARLLAVIRPRVRLRVPDLMLTDGDVTFSRHDKIPGDHLPPATYDSLSNAARDRLADDLACFYADLHAIDRTIMREAGAGPIEPWYGPETIRSRVMPLLSGDRADFAARTIEIWQSMSPDPHGETYGFFDGHGWNMAFDHAADRLNGIYDFADSGFGPLHQEFVYPGLIAADLVWRILPRYSTLTGRALDRDRVMTLIGAHRLFEIAQHHDDPANRPAMLASLDTWLADLASV